MTFRRKNYGGGHGYELDGQKIPGVTRILDSLPKNALVGWAAGCTADFVADRLRFDDGHVYADEMLADLRARAKYPIPDKSRTKIASELKWIHKGERDIAANQGTKVHALAAQLASTGEADVPEHLAGHVDAYLAWRDLWLPSDELVERPVLNRTLRYAGTLDILCHIDGLGWCLIDAKTSRSGVFGTVALQLAAYRYAEFYLDESGAEQPMPEIDGCYALWLRGDRTFDFYPIRAGEAELRIFRHLYQVAMWLDGPKLTGADGDPAELAGKGEPLQPPVRAEA